MASMNISIDKGPWYSGSGLLRRGNQIRKYPILPVAVLLIFLVIPAAFAPLVAPHPPTEGSLPKRLQPPVWQAGGTWENMLGTDKMGRDILSRIIHGAKYAVIVSLSVIAVSGVIGVALGIVSAYVGGVTDSIIMRLVDIALSIPAILLALAIVASQGPSLKWVIIVIVCILWSRYARQVRGEVLGVRTQDFIDRARVSGCSHLRIILRHIFPNVMNTIVVLATLQIGFVIILESSLSFLGAGIPRPTPAWGLMVSDGRELIVTAWWVSFFPGLAILLVCLSLNLFGDWLRDHLDPKLRNV